MKDNHHIQPLEHVWGGCPDCDEMYCNEHHQHASDCPCPSVEVWLEEGFGFPQDTHLTPEVSAWIKDHPYEDPDDDYEE